MDVTHLLVVSIHTIAFVIAWGYYGILGRIVLPALERSLEGPAEARALVAIERRALPLLLLSVALFVVTGTWLLFIDPRYAGLGNFLANDWTMLMLIKHIVVAILVVAGITLHGLVRIVGEATDEAARRRSLGLVRWSAEGATGVGAVIVLLTAAAQLST